MEEAIEAVSPDVEEELLLEDPSAEKNIKC